MINSKEVQKKLDTLLARVEKPAAYIGGEPNEIRKADGSFSVRLAFCFPDTYEIGMSWNGMPLLYHIINSTPYTYMERVFAPRVDMADTMKAADLPLYTLETKTPVAQADIVGFTLQYEMSYTSILYMMDLAGIPFRTAERGEEWPLVIAGGPCAYNTEPLADFFDAVLVGDGEELLPKVCAIASEFKNKGLGKKALLGSFGALAIAALTIKFILHQW